MPSLAGLPEAPCARCGRHARIQWGELCPICYGEREEQAGKYARWISIAAAVLVGVYAVLRIPAERRYYAAISVLVVYVIVRRIAGRLAMEFLPRDWEPGKPAVRKDDEPV
jgi:hypothetical protein